MYKEYIWQLILVIVGSGIATTLINILFDNKNNKKNKEIQYLRDQLDNLYGKLYYWVGQNKFCYNYEKKMSEEYKNEYCSNNYKIDDNTHNILDKETNIVIETKNKYLQNVDKNNAIIVKLLQDNFSYIDIDDIEIFQKLISDEIRKSIEFEKGSEGKKDNLKIPSHIYDKLSEEFGKVSFMTTEFIIRVEKKYKSKKKKLDKLMLTK